MLYEVLLVPLILSSEWLWQGLSEMSGEQISSSRTPFEMELVPALEIQAAESPEAHQACLRASIYLFLVLLASSPVILLPTGNEVL